MDKKEMPTSVLIPRLLQSMKHLLPRIAVAVCFAVLGQVVTIAIPVMLVYLALMPLLAILLRYGPWESSFS